MGFFPKRARNLKGEKLLYLQLFFKIYPLFIFTSINSLFFRYYNNFQYGKVPLPEIALKPAYLNATI